MPETDEKDEKEAEGSKWMKYCNTCRWHTHEDIDDGYICVNDASTNFADWTEDDDSCEAWEERQNER